MTDYTISPARYAGRRNGKQFHAVRCPSTDGFKTRAARLAEYCARGRFTNRESAYIMGPRQLARFIELYNNGADASPITGELRESP